jgi:hypothetical protein
MKKRSKPQPLALFFSSSSRLGGERPDKSSFLIPIRARAPEGCRAHHHARAALLKARTLTAPARGAISGAAPLACARLPDRLAHIFCARPFFLAQHRRGDAIVIELNQYV